MTEPIRPAGIPSSQIKPTEEERKYFDSLHKRTDLQKSKIYSPKEDNLRTKSKPVTRFCFSSKINESYKREVVLHIINDLESSCLNKAFEFKKKIFKKFK